MEALTQSKSNLLNLLYTVATGYAQPLKDFVQYLSSHPNARTARRRQRIALQLGARASSAMAQVVCVNQSEFLQYSFLSAELHRQLRKETAKTPPDPDSLADSARQLVEHMNEAFYKVAQSNFALLQSYFEGRRTTPPRICLKGNFRFGTSDTVVTVFRDRPVRYSSNAEIGRNSGFAQVHQTGRFFLDNDILLSASGDKYFNPRLDNDRVKALLASGQVTQRAWEQCWDGASGPSDAYRSTLIIPLTLWNGELHDRFKAKVRISNIGRTIFGYLCLDHSSPDYFDEKHDVSLGYVVADFLSMYLFTRTVNIDVSKTFSKAEKLLTEFDRLPEFAKLRQTSSSTDATASLLKRFKHPIARSGQNDLFQLDSDLVRYVGASDDAAELQ
jgi:hypothetical protein